MSKGICFTLATEIAHTSEESQEITDPKLLGSVNMLQNAAKSGSTIFSAYCMAFPFSAQPAWPSLDGGQLKFAKFTLAFNSSI